VLAFRRSFANARFERILANGGEGNNRIQRESKDFATGNAEVSETHIAAKTGLRRVRLKRGAL